jgi:hypothetical protein
MRLIEKDGLELHAPRTDVQDGEGNVVDEGKGPLTDLKSRMPTPLAAPSHIHHHLVDPTGIASVSPTSLLRKSRQYSVTSSRRCSTLRRK